MRVVTHEKQRQESGADKIFHLYTTFHWSAGSSSLVFLGQPIPRKKHPPKVSFRRGDDTEPIPVKVTTQKRDTGADCHCMTALLKQAPS
jgi:hypothetical protein